MRSGVGVGDLGWDGWGEASTCDRLSSASWLLHYSSIRFYKVGECRSLAN